MRFRRQTNYSAPLLHLPPPLLVGKATGQHKKFYLQFTMSIYLFFIVVGKWTCLSRQSQVKVEDIYTHFGRTSGPRQTTGCKLNRLSKVETLRQKLRRLPVRAPIVGCSHALPAAARRGPIAEEFRSGLPGGPRDPRARALYLGEEQAGRQSHGCLSRHAASGAGGRPAKPHPCVNGSACAARGAARRPRRRS